MLGNVKDYRRLPYTRRAEKVEQEGVTEFVAYIEEIPWIRVHADEREEAYLLLDESFEEALQAMLDAGDEVPKPEGTVERFGEPGPSEPVAEKRWSTSRQPETVHFEPQNESPPWASGSLDPEREVESSGV